MPPAKRSTSLKQAIRLGDEKGDIPKMVKLAKKILDKIPIGTPQEEGFFPGEFE